MAPIRVAGELYVNIDGQMREIKRQLRQKEGYPYDPMQLVEHLQAAIEGNLVDRHGQPFKTEPPRAISRVVLSFAITCEGRLASELVNASRYDWHNELITDKLFPIQPHVPVVRKLEFIECDFDPSSEQVLEELKRHGLIRPTAEDALEFGKKHPEEQRKRPLVFLHEPVLDPDGGRNVLVLDGLAGRRDLDLHWLDRRWAQYCLFAGVRE